MEWIVYSDSEAFAARVKPLLYKEEDKNSLFIGVLAQIEQGRFNEYFMAIAEEGEEVAAACLMTPPEPLQLKIITPSTGIEEELVRLLLDEGVAPSGLIGERQTVGRFSEHWSEHTGSSHRVVMDTGLHRIDAVVSDLEKSPGSWRIANKQDKELLTQWYLLFEQESRFLTATEMTAAERIDRFIEDKEVYVWETDGQIVACVKKSRPTKKGVSLSFVFAPEEYRQKGFVRTLIAEVTEELLLEFDFIVLYGDLLDADTKQLYREIGYEKIDDPVHVVFSG